MVFYFLQGEDGESMESPNLFNVSEESEVSVVSILGSYPRRIAAMFPIPREKNTTHSRDERLPVIIG